VAAKKVNISEFIYTVMLKPAPLRRAADALIKAMLRRPYRSAAGSSGSILMMVWNYTLNNLLTYRDTRRRGLNWIIGLVSFLAVCSVGAVANVGVALYLFERRSPWTIAAIGGVLVGAVWISRSAVLTRGPRPDGPSESGFFHSRGPCRT
jgi:hypothetical protein